MMLFRIGIAIAAIIGSFLYPGNALAYVTPCDVFNLSFCPDSEEGEGEPTPPALSPAGRRLPRAPSEPTLEPALESQEAPATQWTPPTPRPRTAKPLVHSAAPIETLPPSGAPLMTIGLFVSLAASVVIFPLRKGKAKEYPAAQ